VNYHPRKTVRDKILRRGRLAKRQLQIIASFSSQIKLSITENKNIK